MDKGGVVGMMKTHPAVAADFLLTVQLFVSENPGFHPNTHIAIIRTAYSIFHLIYLFTTRDGSKD